MGVFTIRRNRQLVEARELAHIYGIPYDDLDRAIKEGVLDARRALDGTDWLVDPSDLERLVGSSGRGDIKDAIAQEIVHRKTDGIPSFALSQGLLAIASAVYFLVFLAGIVFVIAAILRRDMGLGLGGFAMIALSAVYLVFYDLLRAVFSMHSILAKIYTKLESIDFAARSNKQS